MFVAYRINLSIVFIDTYIINYYILQVHYSIHHSTIGYEWLC